MFSKALLKNTEDLLANCRQKKLKVVTAESCTGGLIAALLTEIPGSSDVLMQGFVSYANEAKIRMLGVSTSMLEKCGAVSEEVAMAMAEGALQVSEADLSVAVTGVAGPGGGMKEKPVGLVHIASGYKGRPTLHERFMFSGNRHEIRLGAVEAALQLLQQQLSD
jgi:nicotinamide-nucleotide amidase